MILSRRWEEVLEKCQRCDGTVVFSKEDDKNNIAAADIMRYF